MFSKETIMQKAKSMGKPMDGFGEKELYTATLMVYTEYFSTHKMYYIRNYLMNSSTIPFCYRQRINPFMILMITINKKRCI